MNLCVEAVVTSYPMNSQLPHGIRLTEIRRSDQDALIEFLNDQDIYDRTLRIPFPYTAADAEQWFGIVEKLTKQNGQPVNWAIRSSHDKLIGGVGLEGPGLSRSHRAEIGYWLAKPFWDQGIMTAVVKAVCQHAFDNLGLGKITAHVFSFNAASARVLEKCGFEQEGYLKKHFVKDSNFIDAKAYGLLRAYWRSRHSVEFFGGSSHRIATSRSGIGLQGNYRHRDSPARTVPCHHRGQGRLGLTVD